MYHPPIPKDWAYYEAERKKLQKRNPKFSRAALCRRAQISDTTMFKGIKESRTPIPKVQARIRLVLEAERVAQDGGLDTGARQ